LTVYQTEQTHYPQHLQEPEDDIDEIGSGTLDYEIESQWSGGTPHSEGLAEMEIDQTCDHQVVASDVFLPQFGDSYSPPSEEGASSVPAPDEDPASSPLGPITPFGVFVDRAVAAPQFSSKVDLPITPLFDRNSIQYAPPPAATLQYEPANERPEVFPPLDVVPMTSATLSYKKVADPLAEWIATFIWKVCTTGMCLHAQYTYVHIPSILPTTLTSFTGPIPPTSPPLHRHLLTWPTLSAPFCCLPYSSLPLFFWVSGTSFICRFVLGASLSNPTR